MTLASPGRQARRALASPGRQARRALLGLSALAHVGDVLQVDVRTLLRRQACLRAWQTTGPSSRLHYTCIRRMHHRQHSTSTTFGIRRMLQGRALNGLLSQCLVRGVLYFDTQHQAHSQACAHALHQRTMQQ